MQLATVIGTVVASQTADSLQGIKLLIVQFLNERRQAVGTPQVAGTVRAGVGDLVLSWTAGGHCSA
jgi:microcompartment protein CcmK/EutM